MWLREQRAAGTAWRRFSGGAADTQRQADQQQRFASSASAPALETELIWDITAWGYGSWGPPRVLARPRYWQAIWSTGRWAYFLWGHRRIRIR